MSRALAGRAASLLVLAAAAYYAAWGGEYSTFDLARLGARQAEEAEGLARARVEVDSLRRTADLLESDPATIEAVARERFGMIRDGEILYRFVEVEPAPATNRIAQTP